MNPLTIGLLGALLATNQPQAVSNLVQQQTGVAVPLAASPEEKELEDVMIADDDAQAEVGDWISTNTIPRSDAVGTEALNQRIRARFKLVRQAYEQFLRNHPDSAHGYLALSEEIECLYKCTDYYAPQYERAIRWDDPQIDVQWPPSVDHSPTLSTKDAAAPLLKDAETFP